MNDYYQADFYPRRQIEDIQLAALLGVQRGLDVHVLDRMETGTKPDLVRALGATYHHGSAHDLSFDPDVVIECTGVGQVISDVITKVGAGGVVCLTGVGSGGRTTGLPTADIATELVLQNNVVVGSVNANRRHFYRAAQALERADRDWLGRLVSRRVPPERIHEAFDRTPDAIAVVVDFSGS